MEEKKVLYLKEFLELSKVGVKDLIAAIADREIELRNCYAQNFENLSSEGFVEMMLLDCSFVIMFLLTPNFQDNNIVCILNHQWMQILRYDLILLENQLPFFILEDLLKLSKGFDHETERSMIKFTHLFLRNNWEMWVPNNILEQTNFRIVHHFVDFLRICQRPTLSPAMQHRSFATLKIPTAAELHNAGIQFKVGSSTSVLDIKFNVVEVTLEIPKLKIMDSAEILFRNLQAFEQYHYGFESYVGSYISMLSLLVRTPEDVEILVSYEILENCLEDDEAVLKLLKGLDKENFIITTNVYLSKVIEDLNKYCNSCNHWTVTPAKRRKWMAILKETYLDNPWTIISVVAAGVLLILTIIQTVCSILQVN